MHINRALSLEDVDAEAAARHWSEARDFLEYALSLDPLEPRIGRPLFAAYCRLGMTADAASMLKRFPVGCVDEADDSGLSLVVSLPDEELPIQVYEKTSASPNLPDPLRLAILLEAGSYCELKERYDRAAGFYERAQALAPKNTVVLARTMLLMWKMCQYERGVAIGHAFAAEQDRPDDEQVLRLLSLIEGFYIFSGRAGEGADLCATLQQKAPESGEICARRLSLLWHAGRIEEMIEVARAFLEHKDDETVRLRFALLLTEAGRPDEAETCLEPLWQKAQQDAGPTRRTLASAVIAMASRLTSSETVARGIRLLERLLQQPWMAGDEMARKEALLGLARACGYAGNQERARAIVDDAGQAFPDDPSVIETRADLMWLAGDRDGAIAALRDFIASHPDEDATADLRVRLADRLEKMGDVAGAVAALRENLAEDPDDPSTCNNLGYLYCEHGMHLEEALALIQVAVRAEPHEPAYLDSLGWTKYKLAMRDNEPSLLAEAEEALARAVRAAPNQAVLLDHYGDVLHAMGRHDEAREMWRRAVEALRLFPDETLQPESVQTKILGANIEPKPTPEVQDRARTLAPSAPGPP